MAKIQKYNDLDILSFHPAHAEVADLTPYEKANFERLPNAFKHLEQLSKDSIEAVTIMQDGRILFMCGFVIIWKGVAEMWLLPTVHAQDCPLLFARTVRKFISMIAENLSLHRLQAKSVDDDLHNNFMEFLGFSKEGTLEKYSDLKEDYNHWKLIFPERTT